MRTSLSCDASLRASPTFGVVRVMYVCTVCPCSSLCTFRCEDFCKNSCGWKEKQPLRQGRAYTRSSRDFVLRYEEAFADFMAFSGVFHEQTAQMTMMISNIHLEGSTCPANPLAAA